MQRLFFLLLFFSISSIGLSEPPASVKMPTNLSSERLKAALLQIKLDNEGFSPGVIDGQVGSKSELALKFAQEAGRSLKTQEPSWISWKIPTNFCKIFTPIPESWVARSKLNAMDYESLLERCSEYFHTSENFLQNLNPKITDWEKLTEGDSILVPFLTPRPIPRAEYICISLKNKIILAYDLQNQLLASFPCSIAAKKEKRPVGKLEVCALASDPDYLFNPVLFTETPEAATIRSKLMIPPGPNNPVGVMWIGLTLKGYGIHGTPWPEDIGKKQSHGCFRLTNWDAKRLATILRIGTPVFVSE